MPEPVADPFEIVVEDVRGVPLRVFKHAPASLRAIWDASAVHGPRRQRSAASRAKTMSTSSAASSTRCRSYSHKREARLC